MSDLENKYNKTLEKYETIKKERIANDNFLTIENYLCTLKNGIKLHREKIIKNKVDGSAVVIVALTEDNELILTIQPRVFTDKTVELGFPAGLVDDGEDVLMAAKRELEEEVGASCEKLKHLGTFYSDEACSSAKIHYYFAKKCKISGKQKLDADEFIDIVLCKIDELENFIKKLEIVPVTLMMGYMLLKKELC